MQESKLEKLWEGTKQLRNLKWMDLSNSSDLKEFPDLSTATNLEELILRGCSSLVELPSYIGKLTSLQVLNLNGCLSLVSIPSSFENATNLRELYLENCSNLVELPSIGNASKLEKLNLNYCVNFVKLPAIENATNLRGLHLRNCLRLPELPPSIGTATNLTRLDITGCSSLVKLPSSIGDLSNLEYFNLSNCSSLVELPSSIGNLQKLRELRMCGCSKIEALPTNTNLESLNKLDLRDCSKLKSFPEISTNIEWLWLTGTAIKEVPVSIRSWSHLLDFKMSYFEGLKEFPHAFFNIITRLDFVNEDIKEVPAWVKGMSRLDELRLYNCNNLVSLPQLRDSLSNIIAENCQSLERLDCSFNNPKIWLHFVNCIKLNQEARDLIIMHTSTDRYAILHGTEVPDFFNHRATGGGSLTIKLNESTLPSSLRFKACIMLVKDEEESGDDEEESRFGFLEVNIDIMDKQKDLKVCCTSRSHYIYALTEHIYTFEFEAKEVKVTELLFKFNLRNIQTVEYKNNSKWKIRECGLLQIPS